VGPRVDLEAVFKCTSMQHLCRMSMGIVQETYFSSWGVFKYTIMQLFSSCATWGTFILPRVSEL